MNKRSPTRGKLTLIKGVNPRASKATKVKHVLNVVKKRYKDPIWLHKEISRDILEVYYKKIKGNDGIYVLEEKWDNLIILDACRYDVLKEVLGKDIDYRISRGSTTSEWLRENFPDEKYDDIVYITANPWVSKRAASSFHKLIPLWRDRWDEELGTVHPRTTTEVTLEAAKKYPGKRLIAHYLQPHAPYIVENEITTKENYCEASTEPREFIRLLERGKLSPTLVRDVYKRSLEATLPYVYELIEGLTGRTVITADHGELFGKKLMFYNFAGHPWGVRVPELIQVPWVVFESGVKLPGGKSSEQQELKDVISRLKHEGHI